jgi:hypothetical protein
MCVDFGLEILHTTGSVVLHSTSITIGHAENKKQLNLIKDVTLQKTRTVFLDINIICLDVQICLSALWA